MYIPKTVKKYKPYKCICGNKECKTISKLFRDLDDLRGQYKQIPNPIEDSVKANTTQLIDRWITRTCVHINISKRDLSQQKFNKKHKASLTRSVSQSQQLKNLQVAFWHFHPKILSDFFASSNDVNLLGQANRIQKLPILAPIEMLQRLQLYNPTRQGSEIYTKPDVFENTDGSRNVLLLPNYINYEKIHDDLKAALDAKKKWDALQDASADLQQVTPLRPDRQGRSKRKHGISPTSALFSEKQSGRQRVTPNARGNSATQCQPVLPPTEIGGMGKKDLLEYTNKLQEGYSVQEKEIAHLKESLSVLQSAVRDQSRNIELSGQEIDEQRATREMDRSLKESGVLKTAGMNRISLSSKELYEAYPEYCKALFGFPSFRYMKRFTELVLDTPWVEPTSLYHEKGGYGRNCAIAESEKVLMTLIFMNTEWNYYTIGGLFGIHTRQTVKSYIDKYVPLLGEIGDMLSTFTDFLDADAVDVLEPEWYKKLNLRKVAAVVDGKDFMCNTIRTNRTLNCAQASNKVNHSAFRVLTWSLPCGAIIQRTPAFFGRASEKAVMRAWGEANRLIFPAGYFILGDKGFDNTAGYYTNYNTTLHPSFLTSAQFSRDEVNHNIEICKKRYTCEVCYSRVVQVKKLNGIFPRRCFHHFESIVGWAHGMANICFGYLQKISNYHH